MKKIQGRVRARMRKKQYLKIRPLIFQNWKKDICSQIQEEQVGQSQQKHP